MLCKMSSTKPLQAHKDTKVDTMTRERLSSDNRCTKTKSMESTSLFCLANQPCRTHWKMKWCCLISRTNHYKLILIWKVDTMAINRLLKTLTNIIQTCYIVLNIMVSKVYMSQRKGLVRYYVTIWVMTGLVQLTDALKLRAKAHWV